MSRTKQAPAREQAQADHPLEIARQEARRGNPSELARMRDALARRGIMVDQRRLEPDESGELLKLHKQAIKHEDWQAAGVEHYGLTSRLSKTEQARWRTLVSKAAGREGLLDDIDEDVRVSGKIAELLRRAAAPTPSRTAAPQGAAVLPPAVLADVHRGKLAGVDVAVLGVVIATFASARLHPRTEQRRDAWWIGDGETLVIRGSGLHRLLPTWDTSEDGLDLGRMAAERIAKRLVANGWLTIKKSGRELHVRLGERLTEGGDA